ncbi:TetR/AcrR family transcriptional regulator [Microbacterium sp. NPDC089189]|uniref:TetR/AcrR family transcriptional regulator n=1 Tax=Microbacterium sp. NPDC089189 TaxID=3154972 RepID=UPI003428DF3F
MAPGADTPERRRLAELVADLILQNGLIDLSLSGIARAIGSNNRMLLYYFGSKERLLEAAADIAIERFPHLDAVFDRLAAASPDFRARLLRAWDDIGADENRPYLVMFFHRFAVALGDPARWEEFLGHLGHGWVDRVRAVFEAEGWTSPDADRAATRLVADWRGLQFALLCGMDRTDLTAAYRDGVDDLLRRAG